MYSKVYRNIRHICMTAFVVSIGLHAMHDHPTQEAQIYIKDNNMPALQCLLEDGLNPNSNDLLHQAIEQENVEAVSLLLFFKADPNKRRNKDGAHPLFITVCPPWIAHEHDGIGPREETSPAMNQIRALLKEYGATQQHPIATL